MARHRLGSYYQYRADLLSEKPVMVHAGATSDTLADAWVKRHGGVAYGVQADIDVCRRMGHKNHRVINAALAPLCGLRSFYRFTHQTASSVFPLHERQQRRLATELVTAAVTLRAIVDSLGEIDLLLCNCEGAELFALRDMGTAYVSQYVRQACVATHWRHVPIYPQSDLNRVLEPLGEFYEIERTLANDLEYLVMCRA